MSSISHIGSMSRSSGVVTTHGQDFSVSTGKLKYGFSVIKSVFKRTENKQTKTQFMTSMKREYRLSDSQLKTISRMISAKRGTPLSLKDAKQAISFAEKNSERKGKQLIFGERRGLFENQRLSVKSNDAPKISEDQKSIVSDQEEDKQIWKDLDKMIGDFPGLIQEGVSSSPFLSELESKRIDILEKPSEFGAVNWRASKDDQKLDIDQEADDVLSMLENDLKEHPTVVDSQADEVLMMLENDLKSGSDNKIDSKLSFEHENTEVSSEELDRLMDDLTDGNYSSDKEIMKLLDEMIDGKKN